MLDCKSLLSSMLIRQNRHNAVYAIPDRLYSAVLTRLTAEKGALDYQAVLARVKPKQRQRTRVIWATNAAGHNQEPQAQCNGLNSEGASAEPRSICRADCVTC